MTPATSPVTAALRSLVDEALIFESNAGPLRERAGALRRAAEEALRLAVSPGLPVPALSPRELDVLELISRGLTNPETASVLGISLATVRTHVEHVLRKLEASNRVEAVALALRLGLVRG
jgi:DNA-binding CsgD family transcriptional regulator